MRKFLKRIYFAIRPSNRIVILDYPVEPVALYTKENPHQKLNEIISENHLEYEKLLQHAASLKENFAEIKTKDKETDVLEPTWNNNYVPGLDIIILFTLLDYLKPRKYIEIGSGTSTKTALKARNEKNLDFTITCIDPKPRQEIKKIADTWHASAIQDLPLDIFKNLDDNDVVFMDGTHSLYSNSDVSWFFMEILPILPKGVIVQIHDIYLPYDYPQFMLEKHYSENYLLGSVILSNPGKYEIISPNFYISEQKSLSGILDEIWNYPNLKNAERHGGSFWFKIQ